VRSLSLRPVSRHLARHREKRPGGGAAGQRLGNHLGAGGDGADCPSVPSGLAASVESGIGGLFGGSATVCGCCSLCADLTGFFDGLLTSFFDGFSGGITGVASGNRKSLRQFTERKAAIMTATPVKPAPCGEGRQPSSRLRKYDCRRRDAFHQRILGLVAVSRATRTAGSLKSFGYRRPSAAMLAAAACGR
jgi:hypothetical protein